VRKHLSLLTLLLVAPSCGGSSEVRDHSSPGLPLTQRESTPRLTAVPVAPAVHGFTIASIEARLYSDDSTPASPNIIDNAQAHLFNVAHLPLRITVTVQWGPQEKGPARVGLWARVNGKEVFSRDVAFVLPPDSAVHVQEFWLEHGDCDGLLIFAYAGGQGPTAAYVYRYIPYECAD